MQTISALSITNWKLRHDITPLFRALGTNKSLIKIDVSGNNFGDDGLAELIIALRTNQVCLNTIYY